jgi:hypothetical protein
MDMPSILTFFWGQFIITFRDIKMKFLKFWQASSTDPEQIALTCRLARYKAGGKRLKIWFQ